MRLTTRTLLTFVIPVTLALAGCASLPGGGDDDVDAAAAGDGAAAGASTGTVESVSNAYEAGWTVQVADPVTGGVYFVGTQWPDVKVPSDFVSGNAAFTWESAGATGGFFVRLMSDDGDVLWEASGDSPPVTAEFTGEDAASLSKASFMTAGPVVGNVAVDATFRLDLAFDVPVEPVAETGDA